MAAVIVDPPMLQRFLWGMRARMGATAFTGQLIHPILYGSGLIEGR